MRQGALIAAVVAALIAGCSQESEITAHRDEWFTYVELLSERLDHIDTTLAQSADAQAQARELLVTTHNMVANPFPLPELPPPVASDLTFECDMQAMAVEFSFDQITFFSDAAADSAEGGSLGLTQINWRFLINEFHTAQAAVFAYGTFCSQQFPDEVDAVNRTWEGWLKDWDLLNETCLAEFAPSGFVC